MRKISDSLLVTLLATLILLTPLHVSGAENDNHIRSIDHIVAIVNEEVITNHELHEAIQAANDQLQQQGIQPPDIKTMQAQVLETIIVRRIQLQRAKEIGLTVNDSELDETIHRIAEENNLSLQEFYGALEKDGINFSKFRQDIRDEVIMVRLKDREINNQVNITEGEIDNFLRTQETSSIGNDEYSIAHILLRLPENIDAIQIEKKRLRIEAAMAKLQAGEEFAQVAAEYSDAEDAMRGGVLDWRPVAQMGPRFAELLSTMQPGELTPIIHSPAGFHIMKLLATRAQEVPIVIINQTHARHILIKVNELTSEDDALQQVKLLLTSINEGDDFSEVAMLHSDDNSASSGGDLGWISPGDTVPDFEQAMNALLPGQVSEPVQTPFGWHLIQVIERRAQDISSERQRQTARQAIRARKADVVVEEWMRRLRDQAYIEYRMDHNYETVRE